MLIESVAVGVVGSMIGLVAGIGLSSGLSALLKALNVDIPSSGLVVNQGTIVSTIVIGSVVTVLSAILPARRAGKVPPLAAMRATALEIAEPGRKRLYGGLLSIALGIAIISAVIGGGNNSYLGFGILFVFIGTIVLGPIIARPVALFLGRPAARFRGITGVMARQNSARNPKRTSRTASPVLIGVALVTAVTALAASIKGQINDVFTEQFKGDYAVTTNNQFTGGLSPSLALDLNKLPEVEKASGIGLITVKLNNNGQYFTTIDPGTVEGVFDIGLINAKYSDLTPDSLFLAESYSLRKSLPIGTKVSITLGDATQRELTVRGLYEFDELAGNFVVNRAMIASSAVVNFDIGVYIVAKNGVPDGEVQAALEKAVKKYGQGELLSKAEYIDKQSGQVNQLLGLIYGLLMLSIIIAFVGIIITLLLSVFERQRELALLRAVGMTRSQVRTTVRWESVITSLLGAVLGIILGIGLGWVIVFALRDQGLTSFKLPVVPTIIIMVMSFIVGLFAAIYPAWRATRVNILDALNTN
jgi:putative ABC transport system permease protein